MSRGNSRAPNQLYHPSRAGIRLLVVAVLLVAISATPTAEATPPPSPDHYTVRFVARVVSGSDHSLPLIFEARYNGKQSIARFKISLTNERVTLIAVQGSDARLFLLALKRALEAKTVPASPKRVAQLAVDSVILDYKRSTGWIDTKLFFGNNDQGEVYLNLNLKTGLGEFSLKDPDYGNYVLAQLARVL